VVRWHYVLAGVPTSPLADIEDPIIISGLGALEGHCITVARDNGNLTTDICKHTPEQQFRYTLDNQLVNVKTGLCVAARNASRAAGTPVTLAACSNDKPASQLWRVDNTSALRPLHAARAGMCLFIPRGTAAQASIASCDSPGGAQNWTAGELQPFALQPHVSCHHAKPCDQQPVVRVCTARHCAELCCTEL
jgi:hypothetical protein